MDTLIETIAEKVAGAEGSDLFTGMYKVGAVSRTITFKAKDMPDAIERFAQFVAKLKSFEPQKVIPLGHIQYFGCNLEDEIERLRRRNSMAS